MDVKQVVVVRRDLNMRKGKLAAQVAHASMKFLVEGYVRGSDKLETRLDKPEVAWLSNAFTKVVVSCDSEQELLDLMSEARRRGVIVHSITDAGRTEFHGVPTLTCCAFGPDHAEKIDPITGHLKLL